MAKNNISFNNKNYNISDEALSAASAALKSHLSTTMAGTGAKIVLGGTAYNIDSAKLTTATTDFVTHLGKISGSGYKVKVNGVEYSVGSDKVSGSVSTLETVLGGLNSGADMTTLAAGLYQSGAIALYEAGDVEGASAMLKTSWEELVANGVIAISEGVKLPDGLVQNEYGFYYGMPYSMTMEGMTVKFTFNEDGSAIFNQAGEIMEVPAGAIVYGDHSIDMTAMDMPVLAVSVDGTAIEAEGLVLNLEILDLPEMNEYGFYYGVLYSTTMEDMTVGFTFNEDSSVIIKSGNEVSEIPAGAVIYGDHSIDMSAMDMPVLVVSPDGTMIDFDGMILSVGSSNVPPKGTVYLPNSNIYNPVSIIEGDLVLPNDGSATILHMGAFAGQTSLTDILITDGITSIGVGAFSGCSSLTSVVIPDSVTSISSYVFQNCSSLTSINIPDSVTSIGDYAFQNCSGLSNVVIPDSVTTIGRKVFDGCSNITTATMHTLAISNIPKDSLTTVVITSGDSIGNNAFYGCSRLNNVMILDSVTSIGGYAFFGCSSLTSINIPDSVTSIGGYAFRSCSSLTSVVIGNSVTSIDVGAFYECEKLTSITYSGTIAQWAAITLGSKWNYVVPATYVQCSDGQVALV